MKVSENLSVRKKVGANRLIFALNPKLDKSAETFVLYSGLKFMGLVLVQTRNWVKMSLFCDMAGFRNLLNAMCFVICCTP